MIKRRCKTQGMACTTWFTWPIQDMKDDRWLQDDSEDDSEEEGSSDDEDEPPKAAVKGGAAAKAAPAVKSREVCTCNRVGDSNPTACRFHEVAVRGYMPWRQCAWPVSLQPCC
jgi:hypothetical protein